MMKRHVEWKQRCSFVRNGFLWSISLHAPTHMLRRWFSRTGVKLEEASKETDGRAKKEM